MNSQQVTIDKLKAVVTRQRQEFADDQNIRSIGWGLKRQQGSLQDTLSIIFYVKRKLTSPRSIAATGSTLIPAEIDGFPTDVEEIHPVVGSAGQRDEKEFDPLHGGVATSNAAGHIYWFNGSGTLGMLVHDADDGTPMALSNWHVWADGGDKGDDIIQPGHPTAGDHVEAVTKILACGPLLTSLIEWEVPSPLTAGLYGGAAAAAVAAALSDYRDPNRKGQDQTPTNLGERTTEESVGVVIEHPQLPLPGVPFHSKVKWQYDRVTTDRVMSHDVEEEKVNTQFLLGKMVVTDKASYQPGELVGLTAAIWDYQPRHCDAYHVVAHLIPHARPKTALRVVLQPSVCPRTFPQQPPEQNGVVCVSFDDQKVGEYPYKGKFNWLGYLDSGQQPVRIVDWFEPFKALQISQQPLVLTHAPALHVQARVAQFTNTPVSLLAYNAAGMILDQKTAPQQQGIIHELILSGEGIVQVVVRGGGGEGLLISYCIEPIQTQEFTTNISQAVAASIREENQQLYKSVNRLKSRRCCYAASIALPPDEKPGKWDVYLTVQNVNSVPEGTAPDLAATTIGGHLISAHTPSAQVLGCTAIMLLDHVFDVV